VIGVVPTTDSIKGGWLPEDGQDVVTVEHVVRHI
jgi:hypothetical protein